MVVVMDGRCSPQSVLGVLLMKKALLAGIAVLFLATGTAHANDQLPEYILGRWCAPSFINTKSLSIYFRPDHVERDRWYCSDLTDGININQGGMMMKAPLMMHLNVYLIT